MSSSGVWYKQYFLSLALSRHVHWKSLKWNKGFDQQKGNEMRYSFIQILYTNYIQDIYIYISWRLELVEALRIEDPRTNNIDCWGFLRLGHFGHPEALGWFLIEYSP
jgi:hypothetical protein